MTAGRHRSTDPHLNLPTPADTSALLDRTRGSGIVDGFGGASRSGRTSCSDWTAPGKLQAHRPTIMLMTRRTALRFRSRARGRDCRRSWASSKKSGPGSSSNWMSPRVLRNSAR